MVALGVWQMLIVAAVILLLFGGQGKISSLMGDVGRGIRSFRSGMNNPDSDQMPLRAVAADRREDRAGG